MGLRVESTKLWQGERELEQPPKKTRQTQWGLLLKMVIDLHVFCVIKS